MKRISTLLLVLMALMALPLTASAEEVTFDFTSPTFRENIGTAMTDTKGYIYNETFTANNVTLQITAGSAPSRIYVDANRGQNLVTYKEYTTLTFKAPANYAITKIEFAAAGNSNINNLNASSGTIEGMTWTGNAEGVRFAQGGTSNLAKAIVTLAAKTAGTTALPAIEYTECANIAAFNALEAGTYAKVTLTDAEVIGKSADGFSTVWIQDATGGCWIQYTSLNNQLNEKTKINGTIYAVKRLTAGNPHMKEAEDTPKSELTATAISDYTIVEGTIVEVNVAANLNKVVRITGATLEETSATAGKLTLGDTSIDVNNGTETANQQLHKIDEWAKDTKLENVTIVAILVAKSATANQLLPISIEVPDATFDFANNPQNWPTSAEITDYETGKVTSLTVNDVVLTAIQNNEWIGNILYKADDASAPIFRVGKFNGFKLTAPEGKAIVKVEVTMATEGQSFDFEASNGNIADNAWTGNATEVTFTTQANRQIAKIDITLADENSETIKPAAIDAEVANITDFNAIEDGKVVKLTLTNARVNGVKGGSYYVEDATGATVIKGIDLTVGTALNGYIVGTKSTDASVDMNGEVKEYALTATDATTFEAAATTLTGTVMTGSEAAAQANYGRLITLENVAISGGNNKTLTVDGTTLAIKARDYMSVLPTDYTWPEKASKITGILVYYVTGWFIMPISADAIVAYVQPTEVMFDFENNNLNLPYGQNGTVEQQNAGDLTGRSIEKDGVVLNFVSAPTIPSRYYLNGSRGLQLQSQSGGQMRVTAPKGYAVTKIISTGNKSVNPSTGAIIYQNSWSANKGGGTLTTANQETQTWTGNAESVRLNSATCYINAITVTLAPVNNETALRENEEADVYTEVADLAAFANVANNSLVKLTLSDAIITSGMVNEQGYYIQDATGGAHFYYTGLKFNVNDVLNGVIYVKKSNQSVGARIAQTENTNTTGLEITANGTYDVVTSTSVEEINTTANKCRVVKLTDVAVKGSNESVATITDSANKTLEINNGKTNNAPYVYQESLSTIDYSKAIVVGILYGSNATTNKLYPLSITDTTTGIHGISTNEENNENVVIYNLQGVRLNSLQKGINIVNGKKIIVR